MGPAEQARQAEARGTMHHGNNHAAYTGNTQPIMLTPTAQLSGDDTHVQMPPTHISQFQQWASTAVIPCVGRAGQQVLLGHGTQGGTQRDSGSWV